MDPVIVIPAYAPTSILLDLLSDIRIRRPHQPIIVINDGSGPETAHIFKAIQDPNTTVLHHAVNLGKGQALKTAFNHVLLYSGDNCPGVVTADADGQHLVSDILAVSDALLNERSTLWIGARAFEKDVPLRSQIGNTVTRYVFRLLIGENIHDTQSGLRAIPRDFLPDLLCIPSTRYEFELDMLVEAAKKHRSIREKRIQTVYLHQNQSSHFRPLVDSLRIYFVFLRFCTLSLVTALLDFLVFSCSFLLSQNILLSFLTARLIAGSFNFYFGKSLIFRSGQQCIPEALRFAALVVFLMFISYGLVNTLVLLFGINVYASKIIAEFCLFFLSFAAQRLFVFQRPSTSLLKR